MSRCVKSVNSHPGSPPGFLLVNGDFERKGVTALGCDGRDVILVSVGESDDLHGGREESLLHCSTDFGPFAFSPRLCDSNLQRPAFPADLLVGTGQPCLSTPLLEEANGYLATAAAIGAGIPAAGGGAFCIELAGEGGGALVDHGFELVIVDVGEGEVEDVAGAGDEGGEEAGEEDCVEDAFDDISDGAWVGKNVEDELRGIFLLIHFG